MIEEYLNIEEARSSDDEVHPPVNVLAICDTFESLTREFPLRYFYQRYFSFPKLV